MADGAMEAERGPVASRFVRYHRTRERALRDLLVLDHTGLAESLAARYVDRGEPYDDLRQVALLGLIKAIERYDPTLGHAFSSFAVPTILGELRRHFRDHGWAVHVPRRLQDLRGRIDAAQERLQQRLAHRPTVAELAAELALCPDEIRAAMAAARGYRTGNLDGIRADRNRAVSVPAAVVTEAVEARVAIAQVTRTLAARDRQLLQLRFGEGLTQSEIAERLGISQVHVSRLLRRCLEQVRAVAAA